MPRDCCYLNTNGSSCGSAPDFEIHDLGDLAPDSLVLDACAAHLGELVGHDARLEAPRDEWLVRPIAA
jgi:hypothetical protein